MKHILLAATILVTGLVAPSYTSTPDWDVSWSAPQKPYRITDNVYYVGTEGVGAYLIETRDGLILIDGTTEKGADIVEANILALGFKLSDVKQIVITHAHFDHAGGLAQLKAHTGAKLAVSEGDKDSIERGVHIGDNDNGPSTYPATPVDRVLHNGSEINQGGVKLIAVLTPGHTKGCTSWYLVSTLNGKPVRVLFYGSMSVAGNHLVHNEGHAGIHEDYLYSFTKLKALKVDVFLPNHPTLTQQHKKAEPTGKKPSNAFINPKAYSDFIQNAEADYWKAYNAQKAKNDPSTAH